MCNAWNHPEGCECGFGPPYSGRVSYGGRIMWLDRAVQSEAVFLRALRELHLDPVAIEKILKRYRERVSARRAAGEPPPKLRTYLRGILRPLLGRKVKEASIWIYVPLFRLHSPKLVPVATHRHRPARVTYDDSLTVAEHTTWSIRVFGIGMGATQELTVQLGARFESEDGAYKLICWPIRLRVSLYKLRFAGPGGTWLRAEVDSRPTRIGRNKTVEDLSPEKLSRDCSSLSPKNVTYTDIFQLSRSHHGVSSYEKTYAAGNAYTEAIGFDAFGLQGTVRTSVTRTRRIALQCELPNGHDYCALHLAGPPGVVWAVDKEIQEWRTLIESMERGEGVPDSVLRHVTA